MAVLPWRILSRLDGRERKALRISSSARIWVSVRLLYFGCLFMCGFVRYLSLKVGMRSQFDGQNWSQLLGVAGAFEVETVGKWFFGDKVVSLA